MSLYQDDAARAAGVWRYRETVRLPSGERRRISGTATLKGKAAARDALEAAKRALYAPAAPTTPAAGGDKTFATFAAEWLLRYCAAAGNRESSRREKETHLRVRLLPYFGAMALRDIDARAVARFVAELESAPPVAPARRTLSPKTIRNVAQNLRKMMQTAEEWGEISKCPTFPRIKRPTRPPAEFYTTEEVTKLVAADDAPDARAALLVAAKCGLRAGELLGLRWEAVNFSTGEIRVDRQISTAGRRRGVLLPVKAGERTVPMTPGTIAALRQICPSDIGASGWVFRDDTDGDLSAGRPRTMSWLRSLLIRAARRAGVKALHPHSLRHSFASNLVMRGVPLIQVKEWLGHTSIATTMIYAHLAPKSNAHLIALLDAPTALGGSP